MRIGNVDYETFPDAVSGVLGRALTSGLSRIIGGARPPVVVGAASRVLGADDKGAVVQITAAGATVITLPNDWVPGEGCIIRRVGAGAVTWALQSGATAALPASRAAHTGIAEQHGEILARVVSNANGASAAWAIEGATA
jgi:hypothetical protein